VGAPPVGSLDLHAELDRAHGQVRGHHGIDQTGHALQQLTELGHEFRRGIEAPESRDLDLVQRHLRHSS
jgi:hypothetical protein